MPGNPKVSRNGISEAVKALESRDTEGLAAGFQLRPRLRLDETRSPDSLPMEARFGNGAGALEAFQSLAAKPSRRGGERASSIVPGRDAAALPHPPSGSWWTRARNFFKNLYGQWAGGPHGFLLMGASFLLGRDPGFEAEHPLDLLHPLEPGWPPTNHPELEEVTGPLSRILGTNHHAAFLVLKDPAIKLWLLEGGEWKTMLLGDRLQLAPGAVFAVGEKPRWANRSGYRPEKTRVYRFEAGQDAAGRWKIMELAHAEDQLEDFLVRQLGRRFSFVSNSTLSVAVRAMVREAEALGGEPQARVEFLKENILESITAITLGAMRYNPVSLIDFLREVFAEFKEGTPDPASVFYLTERLLINFFFLLNPPQQPQKILNVLKNMRQQGYSAGELSRWIDNFDLVPLNFLENVEQIPTLIRKFRSWGLSADRAEALIFRILEGFEERDEVASPEAMSSIARFMLEADWEAEPAVEVAFRTRRILQGASDLRGQGPEAPPRWDDRIYWSYVLNHAARFATYLKGFGIPAERSRQVVESLIGAYREDVVPTFLELMKPEHEVFFRDWKVSLDGLLEEMKQYHPGKN
ncbi:MAG: hypothetical protein U1F66_00060 [bacterium]